MKIVNISGTAKLHAKKSLKELYVVIQEEEKAVSEAKAENDAVKEVLTEVIETYERIQKNTDSAESSERSGLSIWEECIMKHIEEQKRAVDKLIRRMELLNVEIVYKEKTIKKLKSVLKYLNKTLIQTVNRDLRLSFRNLVRTLFKTFDSTSGSDNKIVFQLSNHDFINHKTSLVCLTRTNLF